MPESRMPVRAKANAIWYPPAVDPRTTVVSTEPRSASFGWSFSHPLVDERRMGRQTDPAHPPIASAQYWGRAGASVHNLALIPEIRGAIQTPLRIPLDADDIVVPATNTWASDEWFSSPDNEDGSWLLKKQEALGLNTAFYVPDNPANGYLRTINYQATNRAWILTYHLMTPKMSGNYPDEVGFSVRLGIRNGTPQWRLLCPMPHPDDDSSNYWSLWDYLPDTTSTIVDTIPQPYRYSSEQMAQPVTGWLMFIPTVDRFLIFNSRSEGCWVYNEDKIAVRNGHIGIHVFGCRAWFNLGWVLFPTNSTLQGPVTSYPDWITIAEAHTEASMRGTAYYQSGTSGPLQATYTGAYSLIDETARTGRVAVTVINTSPYDTTPGDRFTKYGRRRTPIIWSLDEIHKTVMTLPDPAPSGLNISAYLLSFTAEFHETGRGSTAKLRLRNYSYDAATGAHSDPGVLDPWLLGMGRVVVQLAHEFGSEPDGTLATVFTGYTVKIVRNPDNDNDIWPTVELELMDRSALWMDGQAVMAPLPNPAGWDFRTYCKLLLRQWEVPVGDAGEVSNGAPAAQVYFPGDYDTSPVTIPDQEGGSALRFDPTADIMECLDRLCDLCGFRWYISPSNIVTFLRSPRDIGAVTFDLDMETSNRYDRIYLPVETVKDFARVRTMSWCRGRNKLGRDIQAIYRVDTNVETSTNNPNYVGRHLGIWKIEDDNPTPSQTAQKAIYKRAQLGTEIRWRTVGRDLLPGDIVNVLVTNAAIAVPANTKFRILSKTITVRGGREQFWWEDYSGTTLPVENLDV